MICHLGKLRLRVGRVAEHKKMRESVLATRCREALWPLPSLFVASGSAASGLFDRPVCLVSLCRQFCPQKVYQVVTNNVRS